MLETTPVLVDPADNAFDFHGAADPLAPNLLNHATSRRSPLTTGSATAATSARSSRRERPRHSRYTRHAGAIPKVAPRLDLGIRRRSETRDGVSGRRHPPRE